jgi:hypothetical protein
MIAKKLGGGERLAEGCRNIAAARLRRKPGTYGLPDLSREFRVGAGEKFARLLLTLRYTWRANLHVRSFGPIDMTIDLCTLDGPDRI